MQVSVTSTEGLERRMTVEVPADRIEQEVADRLKSMSGRVRISGFRPGKVPMKVIKQRYGAQVRQEVESDLMRSAFVEALQQENLNPAGTPKLELGEAGNDDNFSFTATFEVYPEVKVQIPADLTVERPDVEITDQDIDNMIEKLRKQRAGWEAVDRAAEDGDQVMIDFLGKVDGEAFQGGEGKDYPLVLGSNRFIAGFEGQLVGAKAGDQVDVNVTFPEDYQNKDLAGKSAVFEVTVNTVNGQKLPEINDKEFMAALGVQEGGEKELREEVKNSMARELAQTVQNKLKEHLLDNVLDANEIDLPKALIENEMQQMANQSRQSMGIQGEMPLTDEIRTVLEPNAKRRVSLGLLLGEVIREQGFKADADKVRGRIEAMAESYEDPAAVVNWYYEDKSRLSGLEALVLEDQVVEWLLSQGKVTDVKMGFDEVMEAQAKA